MDLCLDCEGDELKRAQAGLAVDDTLHYVSYTLLDGLNLLTRNEILKVTIRNERCLEDSSVMMHTFLPGLACFQSMQTPCGKTSVSYAQLHKLAMQKGEENPVVHQSNVFSKAAVWFTLFFINSELLCGNFRINLKTGK